VISLEWGALLIRLGTLVLAPTLVVWGVGSVVTLMLFVYELSTGGQAHRALAMWLQFVVPGVVTWRLTRYLRQNAEDLVTPPSFEADEWTDESQRGQELLTAALVLVGSILLIAGSFSLISSWHLYATYSTRGVSLYRDSDGDFAVAMVLRNAVGAGVQIAIALVVIFAGRRIAARFTR
jgi:hypothetical protein